MSLTPMLQQYQSIRKTLAPNTILFFRLGDFYEMFFEDAKTASAILDITLTGRDGGQESRIPMCGVPYHAAQGYINRLTRAGLKVAICDQVEDPKLTKGLVRREIVRMVTPATNLEDDAETAQFNYIAAFCQDKKTIGLSYLDLGTGEFRVGQCRDLAELEDELNRLDPRECVLPAKFDTGQLHGFLKTRQPVLNEYEDWIFDRSEARKRITDQFKVASLASFGIEELASGTAAAGALLYYLKDNLRKSLEHVRSPLPFYNTRFMALDKQTIRNLELVSSASGDRQATLAGVLDRTVTPMGGRLLTQWIMRPLIDPQQINQRLDAVAELAENSNILRGLRQKLQLVRDLERLVARLNCGTPSARDIVGLGSSLKAIPGIKSEIAALHCELIAAQRGELCDLSDLVDSIESAFIDQPPFGIRDGGFVRDGYSPELDELRGISTHAKDWIADLQRREIESTGIKSLKIRYNRVFGYYIDITNANLAQVPINYVRKQTLVNSERFIIPELKEYEEKILGAEEKAKELEAAIFEEMRRQVLSRIAEIQRTAAAVAVLDAVASLAAVALTNHFTRPEISGGDTIYIAGGRHPVIEHMLEGETFVDNDAVLDSEDNQLLIITGPNMAGKSTYIRQVGLIVLMAQMGSFVPARVARIGAVDRVFSRIGASDNLSRGESTFMVEMIETANILHNATSRSLLVFDEIGRGTSTFDGLSIAWSVCEYLNQKKFKPKCLFATHYHELTELADHRPGIKNFNVTVKEIEDSILFLRKVVPGGADRSYGIHVGKLAGLPAEIIARAEEVLLCLEEEKISEESITEILKKKKGGRSVYDLPLFKPLKTPVPAGEVPAQVVYAEHPLLGELRAADPNSMTPLEALTKLAAWKKELDKNPGDR
jgi:DNA mismatch repair protein MutS